MAAFPTVLQRGALLQLDEYGVSSGNTVSGSFDAVLPMVACCTECLALSRPFLDSSNREAVIAGLSQGADSYFARICAYDSTDPTSLSLGTVVELPQIDARDLQCVYQDHRLFAANAQLASYHALLLDVPTVSTLLEYCSQPQDMREMIWAAISTAQQTGQSPSVALPAAMPDPFLESESSEYVVQLETTCTTDTCEPHPPRKF